MIHPEHQEAYLENVNLFFATPCYGGSCGEPYLRSVIEMTARLSKANVSFMFSTVVNESLITRARNTLVHRFLASDATHLIFIDADIRFQALDPVRMVLHDKDVVVGAYPMKSLNLENVVGKTFDSVADIRAAATKYVTTFVFDSEEAASKGELTITDGLVPVYDAGTGFMCIKRSVIEQMIEAHPETAYIAEREMVQMHALFDTEIDEDGRYLSEDYTFCRRWQKVGGTIWLDPEIVLDHFGTIVYMGNKFMTMEGSDG